MDLTYLWIIIGIVLVASVATVGLVAVRKRASLRAGERRGELSGTSGPYQGDPSDETGAGGGVRLDEREPEAGQLPPIALDPETPVLERPESPSSRMARLRRRLAGSNSALSR
ncbi:MAG: signal recognition particle-docking protein FtsY, partial [Propionibacteriaceae bacterium]